jgi:hypothetical protein
MATSLAKLTLQKDQLAVLGGHYQQFGSTLESFVMLNRQRGYKETVFQSSLLLERLLRELEDQKGALQGSFLVDQADG